MNSRKNSKLGYSQSEQKFLASIFVLSSKSVMASKDGLVGYLNGRTDLGVFSTLPFYGSLLSYKGKKSAATLRRLLEKGAVIEKEVPPFLDPFYELSEEGEKVAKSIVSRYHYPDAGKGESLRPRFLQIDESTDK